MTGSPFKVFYLLFRSNAKEVIQGNKDIEKSTKDTEKSLKSTTEEAKRLGQEYTKLIDNVVAAAGGAWAGFTFFKNGIEKAADYNSQLKVMADLTGQNAQQLKTMGAAAAAAGGSAAGALSDIQGLTNMAISSGKALGPVDKYFDTIRDRLKGLSKNEQQFMLGKIGINDAGNRWLLTQASDDEYDRRMSAARSLSPLSDDAANLAFKRTESLANSEAATANFFTTLGNTWIDGMNKFTNLVSKYIAGASPGEATAAVGIGTFAGGAAALKLTQMAGRILGGGVVGSVASSAAGTGVLGPLAGVGAAVGVASLPVVFHKEIADLFDADMQRGVGDTYRKQIADADGKLKGDKLTRGLRNNNPGNIEFNSANNWLGQTGVEPGGRFATFDTPENGIRALSKNLQNYANKYGLNTIDGIINRWAPGSENNTESYINQIVKKTGFSRFQKLNLNDPKTLSSLSSGIIAHENGGNPFSNSEVMSAVLKGQSAFQMAANFPTAGGGSSNSVTIDKIEVVTQATDAAGIASSIREAMRSEIDFMQAHADDGEKM